MFSLDQIESPIFTPRDLATHLGRTEPAVHALAKRAVAMGKIIRIRKGLYTFPNKRG